MKARLAITLVTLALTTTLASCAGGGPSRSPVEEHYRQLTVRARVIRAYPYRKQLIANAGLRDGLREGDILLLIREGAVINHVLVENVQESTFYGSTMDRDPDAPQPVQGDEVVRDPRLYEEKNPPAASENTAPAETR